MMRKAFTGQQIKSKYNSISKCLAICYIQTKRILEDAELLDMDTKPIKEDLACFIQEFMQLCMQQVPFKTNTAKTKTLEPFEVKAKDVLGLYAPDLWPNAITLDQERISRRFRLSTLYTPKNRLAHSRTFLKSAGGLKHASRTNIISKRQPIYFRLLTLTKG